VNAERFPGGIAATRDGRILFDNAAATQIPSEALAATLHYLEIDNAQKGASERGARTTALVEAARSTFAELIGVAPETIGFGANATSIALAFARTIAHAIQPGDRIVITAADHYANVVPWLWLRRLGAVVEVVPVDEYGDLDEFAYGAMLGREPLLVALPWASNVTGTVYDVDALSRLAAEAGALVVVDAVQAAPHFPLTIPETVDFAFFSAYKVFAPHIGAWYARPEVIDRFFRVDDPFVPSIAINWTMETGTQSHEALAGWLGTVAYLREFGGGHLRTAMERFAAYEHDLARYVLTRFAERTDRFTLYGRGPDADRLPVFAFNLHGEAPAAVAAALEAAKIEARVGDFYAPRLMHALAHDHHAMAARLSLAHYNTCEEVDHCFGVLDRIGTPQPA
jgi:cysteine desulfurase family protein (TIGR01976 family)